MKLRELFLQKIEDGRQIFDNEKFAIELEDIALDYFEEISRADNEIEIFVTHKTTTEDILSAFINEKEAKIEAKKTKAKYSQIKLYK
jgi:hypothetical protein